MILRSGITDGRSRSASVEQEFEQLAIVREKAYIRSLRNSRMSGLHKADAQRLRTTVGVRPEAAVAGDFKHGIDKLTSQPQQI